MWIEGRIEGGEWNHFAVTLRTSEWFSRAHLVSESFGSRNVYNAWIWLYLLTILGGRNTNIKTLIPSVILSRNFHLLLISLWTLCIWHYFSWFILPFLSSNLKGKTAISHGQLVGQLAGQPIYPPSDLELGNSVAQLHTMYMWNHSRALSISVRDGVEQCGASSSLSSIEKEKAKSQNISKRPIVVARLSKLPYYKLHDYICNKNYKHLSW